MSSLKRINSTYKKRSSKGPLTQIQNLEETFNLSITDCTCPICLEILVEPVVLPCKHELCLPCFSGMTDKTNFLCPMCRMRISTWSRTASNKNTLVNKERWDQIQKAFPNEIKDRLEGKTAAKLAASIDNDKEKTKSTKLQSVSKPGEIRQEYECILKREQERLRLEKEQEEKLSLQYIEQVIEQENHMTVSAYVEQINNTPVLNPRTSQTPQVNTPVIIRPRNNFNIPSTTSNTPSLTDSTQPINTPVITQPISQPIINTPSLNESSSPPRRISSRLSTRRNQQEKQDIRAKLLISIAESKSALITSTKQKQKRKINESTSANTSIVSNEDSFALTSDINDTTVSPRSKIKRDCQVKKPLQRRASTRVTKPRQTNL